MELLANDLSIHGQFHDGPSLVAALHRLMQMRAVAKRYGREVACRRAMASACPRPSMPLPQAIGMLAESQRRAVMSWLTHAGPFWDDVRRHGEGDWFECTGEIVTDSAIGEAAFRTLHGVECNVISVRPSAWEHSPLEVIWRRTDEGFDDRLARIGNWLDAGALESELRVAEPPVGSWTGLRDVASARFDRLTFTESCFEALVGVPFSRSSAERLLVLLGILDRFGRAFDASGRRTAEGQRLYQDYFTGDGALFSDSSDSEKRDFATALTFPHPEEPGGSLFCAWHGKARHLLLRLHFSWPIVAGEPVYVVYVGPKLTKR